MKSVAFVFGRLNKLESFHSSVLQELSNLEKDLQALKYLEEDAVASSFVPSLGRKTTFSRKNKRKHGVFSQNLCSISGVLGETVGRLTIVL